MQNHLQNRSQDERESLGDQILAYWRKAEAERQHAREQAERQGSFSDR
jgi:hypothetical protein